MPESWRLAKEADLDKEKLTDALNQSEGIGDEIFKVITALKSELKAVLVELEEARTKVVANNTKFLAQLNKLPQNDERKTIRDWAKAD
ncbi:hypothetical protein FHL15_010729 [Xylaria flabelliformis]|uniref:Uncharacterized protein n=1 Tax=Xylaria flabelliformis TaxID=2512241 RepID=A0A553HK86_9PEZI|nr:hypothetical protein FHL15_010729 [Xylaria flabelliformis]